MPFNLNSYVTRWIAFGGAAVAAIVATFAANEAQALFHLSLNQGTLVAYLTPFTIGTFGLAWKWLEGRADQELTALEHAAETDLHVSPAVIAEIERIIEQHLPEPPATKSSARKR
jgi:hypothetical protein